MSVTRLANQRYRIEIDRGRSDDGRRLRYYETVRGPKREAEARERELRRLLDGGLDRTPMHLTLQEWLARWLSDYVEPSVSPRTLATYRQSAAIFRAGIGAVRLHDLRPDHIQRVLATYVAGGHATRTAQKHLIVLRGALRRAVRSGLIVSNPADAVATPRAPRREMQIADNATLARLLEGCADDDFRRLIYFAVQTGLRAGEILGLRWTDVDWERAQLKVQRARNAFVESGFAEPKARSRRSVAASAGTLEVLREHRAAQNERRLLFGADWPPFDLVFPRADGSPESVNNLSKRWGALRDRLGFPGLRFHDLRHTSATLALQAGIHPKVVQERLGHSTISVTLDTYSHVLPNMQREAATAIDALVPRPAHPRAGAGA